MFLRKRYVALYCIGCLKDFKEGDKIVSTSYSSNLKLRHLNCWVSLWRGNEKFDVRTFLHSNPENPRHFHGRQENLPKILVPLCPHCQGHKVVQNGYRTFANHQVKQIWKCKDCGHRFSLITENIEVVGHEERQE